ncbi:MAG TPA: transposase [Chloroflexia bacterium]|nr:transposase [Chloroflexia bacterium]
MASRLYRSTVPLFRAVERVLRPWGFAQLGSPTFFGLLALFVTGLVLLDARPTQTRVSALLPARAHDALNRLLRTLPLSTRALLRCPVGFARAQGQEGYLVLDEVVIEKAFARRLPWAAWVYSSAHKRLVYGVLIVVLVWCSDDRAWRIPVGFRLWRPKPRCARRHYRTRLDLAQILVQEVLAAQLPVRYLVFDTHYTAGRFTKWLTRHDIAWQGTLDPRTKVVYPGVQGPVGDLARRPLKWRPALGLRAGGFVVYAPTYGHVRLVVTRNSQGNQTYLVSNVLTSDLTSMVSGQRSRWRVETVFRDSTQWAGLGACQSWVDQALVRHVGLVLVTFVVLQVLRERPGETVGAVKRRWQLACLRDGQAPPAPLRAAPREFRSTA